MWYNFCSICTVCCKNDTVATKRIKKLGKRGFIYYGLQANEN